LKRDTLIFCEKKNRKFIPLAILVGGSLMAGFAAARLTQTSPAGNDLSPAQANVIVEKLTHHQAHVSRVFHGPAGLTGVIISGKQGPVVSWITNTRSAVIVGGVVDAKTNKNLTYQATLRYLTHSAAAKKTAETQPAAQPKAVTVSDTSSSSGADPEAMLRNFVEDAQGGMMAQVPQQGLSGSRTIYVFFDPNCIFCHKLFEYVQAHKAEFQHAGVRIIYLPVAILKQSSIAKAAEVVKEGWPALLRDESRFNVNSEEGGIAGLSGAELSNYAAMVRSNTDWLKNLSAANHTNEGTPFLVWKAGDGRVYYLDGFPTGQGVKALLASMQPGWSPKKK
jgi:thiol:disulfide interchange protein DsbG